MNFSPKKLGCCLGCDRECFEVLGTHPDGPLEGHPNRLGPMRPHGVQVGFLLSDGTEADVTFCRTCAAALTPADYPAVWEACLVRGILSHQVAKRPHKELLTTMLPLMRKWPVAVAYWRTENQEIGRLVLAGKEE